MKKESPSMTQRSLTEANRPIVAFIALMIIGAEIFFSLYVIIYHFNQLENYIPNLISYAVTIMASLYIYLVCRKKSKASEDLMFFSQIFFLIYITAWGLFITYLDYTGGGHITVFLTLLLSISTLVFITIPYALVYFILATAALLAMVIHINPETGISFIFNIISYCFFAIIGSFVKINHYNKEMQANISLSYLSYHDNLTGLLNRNALERDISKHSGEKRFLLLLDIDDFKAYNDNLGHEKGDAILKNTSKLLSDIFGAESCYRYGGDEFLIVSANRPENWKQSLVDGERGCTYSGAYFETSITSNDRNLIMSLDKVLYDSKKNGKNLIQEVKPNL